jgi:hypothetical protein
LSSRLRKAFVVASAAWLAAVVLILVRADVTPELFLRQVGLAW